MNPQIMYEKEFNNPIAPILDMFPRLIDRKLNIIRHAACVVEQRKGYVTNEAVADYLGVSIDEYNHILKDANIYRLFNSKQEVA